MTRRTGTLLAILALSFCNIALAQDAGSFTPTGSMTTGRAWHTATLLPNGKVLITGGTYSPGQFGGELYDPDTRTFTASRGTRKVSGRLATLLGNGKILIAGSTAQLYDPATDTLAPTGSYVGAFYYAHLFYPDTATLLQDGRVLIIGNAASGGYVERDELYAPVTGTFTLTGKSHSVTSDSDIWSGHTATLLPDGKVLLAGGVSEDFGTSSIAKLYDPWAETFTQIGNMTTPRAGHTATLLPDGTVLLAGGQPFPGDTSAEIYNPATGTFSSTGNMTTPRTNHTATLLPDGTVLLAGGQPFAGTSSAEIYDPATGTFSSTGNMTTPRVGQAATLLTDGTVLLTGGESDAPLASAELYVPSVLIPVAVVSDLQFDRASVVTGSSYSASFSGPGLTDNMFFDVRLIAPAGNESVVALNWQVGVTATHDVPDGTASGVWTINGVRAHQIETDHTGDFDLVSATITISSAAPLTARLAWNANPDLIAGYNVYRSLLPWVFPSTPINGSVLLVPYFNDDTVQSGQTYYYVVRAVNFSGVEGSNSNQIEFFAP